MLSDIDINLLDWIYSKGYSVGIDTHLGDGYVAARGDIIYLSPRTYSDYFKLIANLPPLYKALYEPQSIP